MEINGPSNNEDTMSLNDTKRKRPVSLVLGSANKVQKRASSSDMTARMMELFFEEVCAGSFKDAENDYPRPVMDRVRRTMQSEYPHRSWTRSKLEYKLRRQEDRYDLFLTLMMIPGVKYDQLSGLPVVPDEVWTSFVAKYSDSWWLRTEPLGDRAVYEVVCNRDVTCEEDDGPSDLEDEDSSDLEDEDLSDLEDEDLSDVEVVHRPRTPTRRLWPSSSNSETAAGAVERHADSYLLLNHIRTAVEDFQADFAGKMTVEQMANVIEKFVDPEQALAWNQASTEKQAELAWKWAEE
jgi:hypothetical protein